MSARAIWCLQLLKCLSLHRWSFLGGSCFASERVSKFCHSGYAEKFLDLRLSLIHNLGIPIAKERQNLVGRKEYAWHTLAFLRETSCCAGTRMTPRAQRRDREGTHDSAASAEVTRGWTHGYGCSLQHNEPRLVLRPRGQMAKHSLHPHS